MESIDGIIEISLKEKVKLSRNLNNKFNDLFLKSLYLGAPILGALFSLFILFAFILKSFLLSIFIFFILSFFVFKLGKFIYAYLHFKTNYEKIRDAEFKKNCIFKLQNRRW